MLITTEVQLIKIQATVSKHSENVQIRSIEQEEERGHKQHLLENLYLNITG